MVAWDQVSRTEVVRAMQEYDRLGPQAFFAAHGFAPTTTYELVWEERRYRRRRSWARPTSSLPASGSHLGISRAARPAR